ncbi:MAG: hypothetical protein II670_00880 [Alphaproteobacteria bacterium]|nr:hypothetical protein [Alphaproteobacteria bacterium]
MIKIKITSFNNIKPIKITLNGWRDHKDIYRMIPDRDNLTLWVNGKNYGTGTAKELLNYLHQQWLSEVVSTKEFKRGLKDCIENGF